MTTGILKTTDAKITAGEASSEKAATTRPFSLDVVPLEENPKNNVPIEEKDETLSCKEKSALLEKRVERKKKSPDTETPQVGPIQMPLQPHSFVEQTGSCALITPLSPEVEALFEKMASCMILLSNSSQTETSLYLESPQFASSVFYGAKITIKEWSTAPKVFNVEISSSALALQRVELHKTALLDAFRQGNFNFSIQRLDTSLQDDDPFIFHRKEKVAHDEEDNFS